MNPWKLRIPGKALKSSKNPSTLNNAVLINEMLILQQQVQDMRDERARYETRLDWLEKKLDKTRDELARVRYGTRQGFKARLRKLFRGWNRDCYYFEFHPAHDVMAEDAAAGLWRSVGDDPYFELIPALGRYPVGWVLLRGHLLREKSEYKTNYDTKLYIDRGQGYLEKIALTIPVTQRGVILELIYLPRTVRGLRWDPLDYPGRFKQAPLVMTQVGMLEQKWRMWRRVSSSLLNKSRWACKSVGLTWWRALVDLKAAYRAAGCLRAHKPLASHYDAWDAWVENFDTVTEDDRNAIRAHMKTFVERPLISILMPVYNTPENFLIKAIDSVRKQIYPNWELCIADDASTKPRIRLLLEQYRDLDPRIKIIFRARNGHISAASNSALDIAQGRFVALLDHDDELAEYALYRVVVEINRYRDAKVIYSDEDMLDLHGQRCNPHFKSDWNPELFYSHNYITHLSVIEMDLLRTVGGFRPGTEGAQDYDLLLRCTTAINPGQIRHIPEILYHWRILEGSTASDATEKPYTVNAGLKSLRDHFSKVDAAITVTNGVSPNFYRVSYPLPNPAPKVTLIVPTRNGYEFLFRCISSLLQKTRYSNYDILIVDNQSDDVQTLNYFSVISKNTQVRIIEYDHPFNFSAINNHAARQAEGTILGFINNDVEVLEENWLNEMVSLACRGDIGVVGAKLLYGDGKIQHGGVIMGLGGYAAHAHRGLPGDHPGYFMRLKLTQALSGVTAACCLVRKEIFDQLGGFEEKGLAIAYNDVDFCLRVREAGYRNVWTPHAILYHHESATRGCEETSEKQARFNREKAFLKRRWGGILMNDPYYNPNLTLDNEHFSIADRPRIERSWKHFLNKPVLL
ncbi:O-antigen biosynthesis protein [Gammaproteobacteria bacterium]